jgi:hypothetical protein
VKRVLIVDDNDRYATNLKKYFDELGIESDRAFTAREGWDFFKSNASYDLIVSDITMETQTSGLWLMRDIFKSGYSGTMAIASTGFDVSGVMKISRYLLVWFCGLDWMIPKIPLKQGEVVWCATSKTKHLKSPF